jgi:hypothetical protein
MAIALMALSGAKAADTLPSFQEVYDLLKTNLVSMDALGLERVAVDGLLGKLSPLACLVTNGQAAAEPGAGAPVSRTAVYDGAYGYLRIGSVGGSLANELKAVMDAMSSSNKIKGWVLDLRYADGADYQAAAAVADRFVSKAQPLLDCGSGMIRSSAKEAPIQVPVMVLINRQTAKAAEALAAVLHQTESAMLLGTNTAGQAFVTRDFPLKTGQILRLAAGLVRIGGGEPMPRQGVRPDILVAVSPTEERAYFDDPYRTASGRLLAGSASETDTNLASTATNRSLRHRINEAELVRILREGGDVDGEFLPGRSLEPQRPVLRDPALARAVDLLKGLAVVRRPVAK